MNETDFIRQQLRAERAHLREILDAVRADAAAVTHPRPVTLYMEWARHRLINQLQAHQTALRAEPGLAAEARAQLATVARAVEHAGDGTATASLAGLAEQLAALIDAWSEPLDALSGRTLRTVHWRAASQLTADTILEERQLYAAARGAVGLP